MKKKNATARRWQRESNKIIERKKGTVCIAPAVRDGGCFAIQENLDLIAIAPEMRAKLDKVATWLEGNAAQLEEYAERCCSFKSIADNERANAKNYRATAADIRKLLAFAPEP